MARNFRDDDYRGMGPSRVWEGPANAPVTLVLDPAGEAKHGRLPATWRPLAEHLRIGWWRLPADVGEEPTVGDVLDGLTQRVHLVASGTAAEPALRLADEHAGHVRSVLVADPAPLEWPDWGGDDYGPVATWWDSATEVARLQLRARGVQVGAFVSRESDPAMRVPPPVPLGHPDVVGRFMQTLLAFQGDRADAEPVEPERERIAEVWQVVQKCFGPPLERARRSGDSSV